MTAYLDPSAVLPSGYTVEMQAEFDRLAAIAPKTVDFSVPPDDVARKIDEDANALWNIDLPDVVSVHRFTFAPDPSLSSAVQSEAVVYTPENAGSGLIFFVHGGGWAFMNLNTHERFMRLLSNAARTTVVGVHYRLAPENPFPAGLTDVVSAFRQVMTNREAYDLPSGPVVIAGDSAGGNLSLTAMLHEIGAGRELPAGGLLFYGVFGADFETESYRTFAEGHVLTRPMMQQLWDWYIPDSTKRNNPLAAPLTASDDDLRQLPPLFLVAAELDPLASDSYLLKSRLDALGRNDELVSERGVIHGFLQMTAVLEAARRATGAAAKAAKAFIEG